ncbi:hypothetical protein [Streptomyces abyssomicinicus]|uniref:hypothetical protein n=1 Tax=Streptomyces abyssomicinicus TaxID=574929 RepID=UPI0012502E2B|nr:hypothetical protein [Streptomyces abyssomicinicus]
MRPRTWVLTALLVTVLLGLALLGGRASDEARGREPLTGPRTGDCAELPVAAAGQPSGGPSLTLGSFGSSNTETADGSPRFTLRLRLAAGERPLRLDAPLSGARAEVTVCAPHGGGRIAHAVGLPPTVERGSAPHEAAPHGDGASVGAGRWAELVVELPDSALRPGVSFDDLMAGEPPRSNDAQDYPLVVVRLTAPGLAAPLTASSCFDACAEWGGTPA